MSFGNSHSLVPVQKEQMLISLVRAIPEAFVLRDEVSAAPGKQRSCCMAASGRERKQEQHSSLAAAGSVAVILPAETGF